jgi:hypothetical protein
MFHALFGFCGWRQCKTIVRQKLMPMQSGGISEQ